MGGREDVSKVALVTGGTRGIGRAVAESLHRDGWHVVVSYRGNKKAADAFTSETGVESMAFDVGDSKACKQAVSEIEERYGVVSVLVNNAGIVRDSTMMKMTDEQWYEVMATNLSSVFYLTRLVLGGMVDQKFGRIVNVSSVNGIKGQRGQANYAASKAGMIGLSKSLALEVARKGVCVNVVAPGYIDTEMMQAVPEKVLEGIVGEIPVQRLGHAWEIGRMVSFLSHKDSGFITGATFSVNGGQLMP
jgi:acetoacetyl-CoA reductase